MSGSEWCEGGQRQCWATGGNGGERQQWQHWAEVWPDLLGLRKKKKKKLVKEIKKEGVEQLREEVGWVGAAMLGRRWGKDIEESRDGVVPQKFLINALVRCMRQNAHGNLVLTMVQ